MPDYYGSHGHQVTYDEPANAQARADLLKLQSATRTGLTEATNALNEHEARLESVERGEAARREAAQRAASSARYALARRVGYPEQDAQRLAAIGNPDAPATTTEPALYPQASGVPLVVYPGERFDWRALR